MSVFNVSSAYLSSALLPAVRQAQSQLANLEVESSTGQYADLGLQLGYQSGYELSLRSQDDLLQAMTSANGVASTNLSTAQSALSSILTSAQSAAQTLAGLNTAANNAYSLQSLGQSNLQQLTALANTTATGGYVFGGQNIGTAPLDDFYAQPTSSAKSAIDSAFQSYFGFSTTSAQVSGITNSQMQGFLSGPFASLFQGSSWTANWSTASDDNTSAQIMPGSYVQTSSNTNTPGFQQLAQGYAMLSEFGGMGLSSDAQQAVVSAATSVINQGVTSITTTQAQLGQSQAQITQANDSISSQKTMLQTELNRLDNVDSAQVATELTNLTTQLQTAYQLTSKINSLNLAQYLPA